MSEQNNKEDSKEEFLVFNSKEDVKKFEERYERAVKEGDSAFHYQGRFLLIRYAKYLLEYLKLKFKSS